MVWDLSGCRSRSPSESGLKSQCVLLYYPPTCACKWGHRRHAEKAVRPVSPTSQTQYQEHLLHRERVHVNTVRIIVPRSHLLEGKVDTQPQEGVCKEDRGQVH